MVNYNKTTLQKEGTLQDGDYTYNVSVTAVNNELTRLYCGITKKTVDTGGQNPVEQNLHLGHITLEFGRVVTEIAAGVNMIPHLTKFQEIQDELLAKTTAKTAKK